LRCQRADNRLVDQQSADRYEAALRRLPDAHSLALRLRDANVADEVICEYLQIEPEGLDGLFEVANSKLAAEINRADE
jgi:hypothetical protein